MNMKTFLTILSASLILYMDFNLKEEDIKDQAEVSSPITATISLPDLVSDISPALVHIKIITKNKKLKCCQPSPSGSGFIIDQSGLILTNAHVVTAYPGSKVEVQLATGETLEGVVENLDVFLDIALLRIVNKTTLMPAMKLGDSDTVRAGDSVIVLGSPLGLTNTITTGIISNTARIMGDLGSKSMVRQKQYFIQTDAFITYGNSGGPLVNMKGEVVGINTMGLESGCNFAIPINRAKKYLNDVAKNITRDRGTMQDLGLTLKEKKISPNLARILNTEIQMTEGLLVLFVEFLSPSYIAGILPGDIILQVDGEVVSNIFEFVRCFWAGKGNMKMKIIRNYDIIDITV